MKIAYKNMGKLATSFLVEGIDGQVDVSKYLVKRDVAKAKALLAEAGYPNGLEVEVCAESNQAMRMDVAEAMQAQLAEVGITVKLKFMDANAYITYVQSGKEHQISIYGLYCNTGEAGLLMLKYTPVEGVYAACYNPTDGKADPFGTVCSYGLAAKRLGVEINQYTKVVDINELPNGNWDVTTNRGKIEAQELIIAAGSWSGLFSKMVGVDIPIKPFVEEALVTEPVAEGVLDPLLNIKTPKFNEAWMTQTTVNKGIIFGWGHMQWVPEDKISYEMTTSKSYAQLAAWNLVRALPALANVNIIRHFSGFYDVTPDREPIVCKISGKNLHVAIAAAFMHTPICGQAIAEMLLDGECTCSPIEFCNIERFKGEVKAIPY